MENNIFSPVVLESDDDTEANAIIAINLIIAVRPGADNDAKGSGLNQ